MLFEGFGRFGEGGAARREAGDPSAGFQLGDDAGLLLDGSYDPADAERSIIAGTGLNPNPGLDEPAETVSDKRRPTSHDSP